MSLFFSSQLGGVGGGCCLAVLEYLGGKERIIKEEGISTVNPPGVWPVFTLPTRGLRLYTLPT